MKVITCPHCGNERLASIKTAKDAVFMPCPVCREWIVMFANRVLAVNRKILESGSFDERKDHIAAIIAEFLQSGMLPDFRQLREAANELEDDLDSESGLGDGEDDDEQDEPISDVEFQRFLRVELQRIDEAAYFKRHFEQS